MLSSSRKTPVVVAVLVLVGTGLPLVLYWLFFGVVPTVVPDEAKRLLRENADSTVLVDVRTAKAFSAGHIEGAINWPLQEIRRATTAAEAPAKFRDKTLLLLCDVSMASRLATWHLRQIGVNKATNVRGGVQEWMRSARSPKGAAGIAGERRKDWGVFPSAIRH